MQSDELAGALIGLWRWAQENAPSPGRRSGGGCASTWARTRPGSRC